MKDSPLVHVSFAKIYRYKGWLFEYDRNKPFGPWPLKENYEDRKKAGKRFYDMFERFNLLSIDEQEKYRVF